MKKYAPFCALCCALSFSLHAQFSFQKTWGGTGDERLTSILKTADGGYLLGGESYNFNLNANAYLAKTDATGALLWEKFYGIDDLDETVAGLLPTPDGGYLLLIRGAGSSLLKTNAAGVKQWEKTLSPTLGAYALAQAPDGGYAVTGTDSSRVALFHTTANGDVILNRRFALASSVNIGHDIAALSDGSFIIAGETDAPPSLGDNDLFLMKISGSGQLLWDRRFGTTDRIEQGLTVLPTPADGGYLVGGAILDVLNFFASPWLIKTDANGDSLWTQTYPEYSAAIVAEIDDVVQRPGGYALCGFSGGFDGLAGFVLGADLGGNLVWERTYQPNYNTVLRALVAAGDGEFTAAGNTYGNNQDPDFYLVKTGGTVAAGEPQNLLEMEVAPNPAAPGAAWQVVFKTQRQGQEYRLTLHDAEGRLLWEGVASGATAAVPAPKAGGAFVLSVRGKGGELVARRTLVVQ